MKTGINFLKFALDKDNKRPMLFDTAEMLQMEIMDEFSKWLVNNNWRLNYSMALWENSVDFNIYSLNDVYQIFLKSKEDVKMKPTEWIQVVFKEKYEKYKVFKQLFNKANGYEFEILDNFSKWLANNKWQLNQTSGLWEKIDNLYHSMSELYQMFLKSKEA